MGTQGSGNDAAAIRSAAASNAAGHSGGAIDGCAAIGSTAIDSDAAAIANQGAASQGSNCEAAAVSRLHCAIPGPAAGGQCGGAAIEGGDAAATATSEGSNWSSAGAIVDPHQGNCTNAAHGACSGSSNRAGN